ncbi:DUF3679 domain-containing protein [Aquibacillus rhizosphaerae]|uniref:DUF3679 domain-containing protein n=1 Tax=Aquibacillus rhizosphaerae TaxID=3051431 RepID=A0ABT7L6K9_9BACI|nr:DUF3679 domain-containing protein [Aquibacillus sp. LR5S19]MDL4841485.1 DUF3679 domain-containing protein [Aquibacillus sp. LR5S19]
MTKVLVSMLLMVILFMGGVLFGIDQANEGIANTRGYTATNFEDAIDSGINEDGSYEVNVMGEDFEQINLEDKELEYEEVQTNHFTQKLAGNLENSVKWFYNQVIDTAYQIAQVFF